MYIVSPYPTRSILQLPVVLVTYHQLESAPVDQKNQHTEEFTEWEKFFSATPQKETNIWNTQRMQRKLDAPPMKDQKKF